MLWGVKLLRIVSLPPLALAVGKREASVVRNPGQGSGRVRPVARLEPPPVARLVHRHAETQTALPRFRRPCPDHVLVRTHIGRIPLMMFRVPGVEAVVVIGKGDK